MSEAPEIAYEVITTDVTLVDPARGKEVKAYVHAPSVPGEYPLIIFSHGLNGNGTYASSITDHWVQSGYIVIAPNHADSFEVAGIFGAENVPPDLLTQQAQAARVEDASFVLSNAQSYVDGLEAGLVADVSTPVIAGHSYGAMTAQQATGVVTWNMLTGQSYVLTDPRFEAALLLSPQGTLGHPLEADSWDNVTAPSLYLTGSEDYSAINDEVTPESRREAFDYAPAGGKHMVWVEGASHSSLVGRKLDEIPDGEAIFNDFKQASLLFLDAYVKGDTGAFVELTSEALEAQSGGRAEVSTKLNGQEPVQPVNGLFWGSPGDDVLVGSADDDLIRPQGGDDVIDGGGGRDIVFYDGPRDRYDITFTDDGVIVTDRNGGAGSDVLSGVEGLRFDARDYSIGGSSVGIEFIDLTVEEQLAALYVGYFGRAPDPDGHDFWVSEYEAAEATRSATTVLDDIAESFRLNPEAQDLFPFLDPSAAAAAGTAEIEAFLMQVYENLFNRAPSGEGLAYWSGEIAARLEAGVALGDIIVDIMAGAQDGASVDIDGDGVIEIVNDATTLLNKIDVGEAYASNAAGFDVEMAQSLIEAVGFASSSVDAAMSQLL